VHDGIAFLSLGTSFSYPTLFFADFCTNTTIASYDPGGLKKQFRSVSIRGFTDVSGGTAPQGICWGVTLLKAKTYLVSLERMVTSNGAASVKSNLVSEGI
jgi:hypothetical protein